MSTTIPRQALRFTIFINGEPISKSNNTFFTKRKVYTPARFIEYEKAINEEIRKFLEQYPGVSLPLFPNGPLQVNLIYHLSSHRKKDLPNLPKTTCDALTGIVYTDDCQICGMELKKFYDKDKPGVFIEVYPIDSNESFPLPKSVKVEIKHVQVEIKPKRRTKKNSLRKTNNKKK